MFPRFFRFMTIVALASWNFAHAAEPTTCAKVLNVSGDTCDTLKFDFDLSACRAKSFKDKPNVDCKGDRATVKVETPRTLYTFELTQTQEGWGKKAWKQSGPVMQTRLEAPAPSHDKAVLKFEKPAPAAVEPEAPRNPASTEEPSKDGFKIGGFVDAQYKAISGTDPNGIVPIERKSGFAIADAALYLSHSYKGADFYLDLPFHNQKDADAFDINQNDVTNDNEAYSNKFKVGTDKAQAYAAYTASDFKFQLGQFDTIYGFELNDTGDAFFSRQGIVYRYMMPVTHTGAMVTFTSGSWNAKLLGANSTNMASRGEKNNEIGAQVGFANETYRFTLGHLYSKRRIGEVSAKSGTRGLTDLLLGATWDRFSLDLELTAIAEPQRETALGFLLMPTVKILDSLSFGLRYEYIDNVYPIPGVPAATHNTFIKNYAAGTTWALNDNLRLRGDFMYEEWANEGVDKRIERRGTLSAVYKFM